VFFLTGKRRFQDSFFLAPPKFDVFGQAPGRYLLWCLADAQSHSSALRDMSMHRLQTVPPNCLLPAVCWLVGSPLAPPPCCCPRHLHPPLCGGAATPLETRNRLPHRGRFRFRCARPRFLGALCRTRQDHGSSAVIRAVREDLPLSRCTWCLLVLFLGGFWRNRSEAAEKPGQFTAVFHR
jgi:hypothetical protein